MRRARKRRLEPTALRAEALLAAAAIHYRSGTLDAGFERAEEAFDVAVAIADPQAEWHALHRLGEFAVAWDDGGTARRRLEQALVIARREGLLGDGGGRRLLARHRSTGCSDELRAGRGAAGGRASRSFRSLAGCPERIPSPLNISDAALGRLPGLPGAEDPLRGDAAAVCRCVCRGRDRLRARQPRDDRPDARRARRGPASCSMRASAISRSSGTSAGRATSWCGAPTSSSPRALPALARETLERAARASPRAATTAAESGSCSRARPARHDPRRRGRGRAGACRGTGSLPPRRRPLGTCERALAHRRSRAGTRPARRGGGGAARGRHGARRDDVGCAGWRTRPFRRGRAGAAKRGRPSPRGGAVRRVPAALRRRRSLAAEHRPRSKPR